MKLRKAVLITIGVCLMSACSSPADSKLVALVKKTQGNANIGKDLINSKIISECGSNVGARAYFGWLEFKPVEITLDKNDQFTGRPMEAYKLYFVVLDKTDQPEEVHRGPEYLSVLSDAWAKIGCGSLPSVEG